MMLGSTISISERISLVLFFIEHFQRDQLIQIYAPNKTFLSDQYFMEAIPPLSAENIYLYSFLFSGNVCLCVVVMLKQLTRPS